MIAIDWGTSSFRAYRLNQRGAIAEKRAAPLGIMHVEGGRFAEALEAQLGDWLSAGEGAVLMSGMIGSRQGWKEAAYVECPAGAGEIAGRLQRVTWGAGREAWIAPGVSCRDAGGVPDVMRGEETQILGVLDQLPDPAWICLPGTHSKWVEVRDGCIHSFTTHMTGEVFATLRTHTILGRMMSGIATDPEWFAAGLQRSREPGGALHHLFGVRARGLFGELPDSASAAYLSGILIGHELQSARPEAGTVYLLGAAALEGVYAQALEHFGHSAVKLDADAAVRGLWRLAQHLPGLQT
jgi:2-dehydro-3-deoxygalactonokinase